MSKHFFLGQVAHFSRSERLKHTFSIGRKNDFRKLRTFLADKYGSNVSHVAITKNGRTALAIALKANLEKGAKVVINGFTCYAVIEAVEAAGMTPVFADIEEKTLHYNAKILEKVLAANENVQGIIVQNTLGIPVDIAAIEEVAKEHDLKIFEDMAHCTGIKYADGREAGTVGVAAALSFGKEKSIDAIVGGAVILRDLSLPSVKNPRKKPTFADTFRARFYPLFGAIYRGLARIKLEKFWMGFLIKTHQVERSANSKLDFERRPAYFVAKTALRQLKKLPENRQPIRRFALVKSRDELLAKLKTAGYYFDGFWFETPIAPARFYKKANFDEDRCKTAVEVAAEIINLPTHYDDKALEPALKIIEEYKK